MKTREPVDDETAALIGKAYVVCSQYPEIFGNVKMSKFCGMFVDVIEEDEDERETRMKTLAPEMYEWMLEMLNYLDSILLEKDSKLDKLKVKGWKLHELVESKKGENE